MEKFVITLDRKENHEDSRIDYHYALDFFVFLCTKSGKVDSEEDVIFYGNIEHNSGAVVRNDIDESNSTFGDVNDIFINLSCLPNIYESVYVYLNIFEGAKQKQTFEYLANSCEVNIKSETGELIKTIPIPNVEGDIAELFCIKKRSKWMIEIVSTDDCNNAIAVCKKHGVDV